MQMLFTPTEESASAEEIERFRNEHPKLLRDPMEYLERGQIFLTMEPDDPAPEYLEAALGEVGRRVCGVAVDYGHWDAQLAGCVASVGARESIAPDLAVRLLGANALDFYGERLQRRIFRADEPG